jgi:hypothetical protein
MEDWNKTLMMVRWVYWRRIKWYLWWKSAGNADIWAKFSWVHTKTMPFLEACEERIEFSRFAQNICFSCISMVNSCVNMAILGPICHRIGDLRQIEWSVQVIGTVKHWTADFMIHFLLFSNIFGPQMDLTWCPVLHSRVFFSIKTNNYS